MLTQKNCLFLRRLKQALEVMEKNMPRIGIDVAVMSRIILGFVLSVPLIVMSDESVVLDGSPNVRIVSSSDSTTKSPISQGEKNKYSLKIIKRNGKYLWASRENKRLTYKFSGAYHYFIEPGGAGYVKVVDRRNLMDKTNPRYLYYEHMSLGLQTYTYWGTAEEFKP